ncbi:MAG: copper-binding protein, partial [Pseudomonadota bacterium]
DTERRQVVIRHEEIAALDWPALESRFFVRSNVPLDGLSPGEFVKFSVFRASDGLLAISSIGRDDGIDATGTGIVHAITDDGKLTLSHDPIPALAWPAMRMDMPVAGIDAGDVPLETPVEFDLAKGADGLFTVIGVRPQGETKAEETPEATIPPMVVEGTINAINVEARTVNASHGPLAQIGMPGMTMDFPVAPAIDIATITPGDATLSIISDPDKGLVLISAEPKPAPMKVMGKVNSIDAEGGTANVTHGPMAEIGMPGMTMDFPLGPEVDPTALPLGAEIALFIEKGADFTLILIGVGEAP